MKVSVNEIENRQAVIDIEVEQERLNKALDQAYRRAANRVNVPGFRKGKAPRTLVERVVGSDTLMQDALDTLLPQVYGEAIESEKIQPMTRPRLEVVSTEPLQVKATVALEPTVTLGDYAAIRRERPSAEPEEDEVERTIQHLRETHAEWAPVERPVQLGDRVTLDVRLEADGRTLLESRDAETVVDPERPQPAPGFAEAVVGVPIDEERQFTLRLPDDYQDRDIAGAEVHVTVTVHGIKERRLPELDDEFARTVGDDYEDLPALRAAVHKQIADSKQQSAARELEDAVIGDAVAQAEFGLPPQLVARQADLSLQQLARNLDRQGVTVEQYIRFTGQTPDAFRAQLLADAEASFKRSLVLDHVADAENVAVSDDELQAEIRRMTASADEPETAAQSIMDSEETRERVRAALRQRAAVRRLLDIAVPGADQSPTVPEEEETHA